MNSTDLQIVLVQNEIQWNDVDTNLNRIAKLLENVDGCDLIVLPEMFATGFPVDRLPKQQETERVLNWMRELSLRTVAMVVGSVAFCENEHWYNRLFCVENGEVVGHYDKRHLFINSVEAKSFTPGSSRPVFQCKGWNICPEICYDLRFPTWSRNSCKEGQYAYDVLLYVANWPATREVAWNTLLKARAIENQSFVLAANCVGEDSLGTHYQGDSQVISPLGEMLATAEHNVMTIVRSTLSKDALQRYRERFPVAKDWD